jgi:hypothetical protein
VYDDVTYVYGDVTYVYDDVTYVYDDVTYVYDDVTYTHSSTPASSALATQEKRKVRERCTQHKKMKKKMKKIEGGKWQPSSRHTYT